jgi:hypothetical protein
MTENGRRPVEGTAGQRQMIGRADLPQLLGAGSGAADDPAFTTAAEPMSAQERAARLDEALELQPGDVRDIAALLREAGRDLAGYDIKVSGNPHQLAEFAAAGATWWREWIPPGEPAGREENPMTPTQPAT